MGWRDEVKKAGSSGSSWRDELKKRQENIVEPESDFEKPFTMSLGVEPSENQIPVEMPEEKPQWQGVGVRPTEFADERENRMLRERERYKAVGGTAGGVLAGVGAEAGTAGLATPALGAAVAGGTMLGGGMGGALYDVAYGKPSSNFQRDPQEDIPDFGNGLSSIPKGMQYGIEHLPENAPRTLSAVMDMPEAIGTQVIKPAVSGIALNMTGETEAERQEGAEQIGKAMNVVGEFGKAMITPYNVFAPGEAAKAWAFDPLGSALMGKGLKEVGSAGISAAKYGGRTATKVLAETIGRKEGLRPEDWMARHLKLRTTDPQYNVKVNNALEFEYLVKTKSIDQFYRDLKNVNAETSLMLEDASRAGVSIKLSDFNKTFQDITKLAKTHPTEYGDIMKVITKEREALWSHPDVVNGKVPVRVAQDWKMALQNQIRDKFLEKGAIELEASKMLATALKDRIAEAVPGIDKLNKKASLMLAFEEDLMKAARRIKNKDLVGHGIPIKLAAAGMYNKKFAPIFAMAIGLLDKASVQGRIAIMLQRAQNRPLLPGQLQAVLAGMKADAQKKLDVIIEEWKKLGMDERGFIGDIEKRPPNRVPFERSEEWIAEVLPDKHLADYRLQARKNQLLPEETSYLDESIRNFTEK